MRVEVRQSSDATKLVGWLDVPVDLDLQDGRVVTFRKKMEIYAPVLDAPEEPRTVDLVQLTVSTVGEATKAGSIRYWKAFMDDGLTIDQLHEIKGFVEKDNG